MSSPMAPPTSLGGILRQIGPGLIITASIVGSGELILTPKLGGDVGFQLLWFIIIGCLIKVFIQIELGRFAISRGMTTLEALDTIPGPRFVVSWILWIWLVMFLSLLFQIAGMIGGIGQMFLLAGSNLSAGFWGGVTAISCSLFLVTGRYRVVEVASTVMVVLFTICTLIAVGALQWTPYHITAGQVMDGLKFQVPGNFTIAFAAFGIIGVGASELIYYPYWCLEKGYATHLGTKDETPEWYARARGWIKVMSVDAWVSLVIYTGATVAFYLLGAAVLHGKALTVENDKMVETLSHMYRETFGAWGFWIFLIGGFSVLYSTVFVASASNARLFADALSIFKVVRYQNQDHRKHVVRCACFILPLISFVLFISWKQPLALVVVGALTQGVMLPFLALAALYFRLCRTDAPLRPGWVWTAFVFLAALSMSAVGIYQAVEQLKKLL